MTKTILLTGATSDLGSALAQHLDQQQHHLILLDSNQLLLERLDRQLQGDHTLAPFDTWAADAGQYGKLATMIGEDYPCLDALIFTEAYCSNLRPIVHAEPELWLKTLQVNLTAPLWLTQALLANLCAAKRGNIVFTTHDKHRDQPAYWHGYGVSQQALHAMIEALQIEKAAYPNIAIAKVDTGWIDTSFTRAIFPDGQAHWQTPEAVMHRYDQALAFSDLSKIGRFADA